MSAKQKYLEEKQKIADRIEDLKKANQEDVVKLADLQEKYQAAVTELDDKKADQLHDEIFKIKKDMDNRVNKISILQKPDNPAVKKAANNLMKDYVGQVGDLREKATEKAKSILEIRNDYLAAIAEVNDLNNQHRRLKDSIGDFVGRVDKDVLAELKIHPKLGLMTSQDLINLHDLEIRHHHMIEGGN